MGRDDDVDKRAKETGGEGAPEREIKVTDRRMFTPEGELREEYREVGEGASQPESEPAPEGGGGPTAGDPIITPGGGAPEGGPSERSPSPAGGGGDAPSAGAPVEIPQTGPGPAPSFLDLVGVLAEPVPLYLGDAELPDGRNVENLDAARLHIDLLDVLRRKTAGNLSAQESSVLEDVIYRLRMRYVQKRG